MFKIFQKISASDKIFLSLFLLLLATFPQITNAGVITDTLWAIVNGVFGTLMAIAGLLLDYSITDFVVKFGNQFLDSGVGSVVEVLWGAIRDIFNLSFIFGLVYIGFKMILNSDDSGTRKWLVNLILAALLVNFSLFITKFVVDVTNVTAAQIVKEGFPSKSYLNGSDVVISKSFFDSMGITTIYEWEKGAADNKAASYGYIFGAAMIFIVATFVFAAGAFLLIIRYAVLCIYMVFSPLMFIGWVFPNMQGVASRYWTGFLGKAFYAPVYLLLLHFANMIILATYGANKGGPKFSIIFGGKEGREIIGDHTFASTIPPFILACVFLISSITIAGKLGVEGAGAMIKIGNNARGKIQRGVGRGIGSATAGSAAYVGRRTIGYAADKAANSDRVKGWAASNKMFGGRALEKSLRGVANSSFDVRNAGGVGKSLGVGTGYKGGYSQMVKDKQKADKEYAKMLENDVDKDKIKEDVLKNQEGKREEINNKRQENEDSKSKEIEKLKTELSTKETEVKNTSVLSADRKTKEGELAAKKAELEKAEKEFTEIKKDADAEIKKLDKEADEAVESIAMEEKYKHVITYIEEMEKSQEGLSKVMNKMGGFLAAPTASGTASTLLGAGALGVGTAGAAGVVAGKLAYDANVHTKQERISALRKAYGEKGEKMDGAERKKKKIQDRINAENELIDRKAANDTDSEEQKEAA